MSYGCMKSVRSCPGNATRDDHNNDGRVLLCGRCNVRLPVVFVFK